jgi:hypothetical protein
MITLTIIVSRTGVGPWTLGLGYEASLSTNSRSASANRSNYANASTSEIGRRGFCGQFASVG